VSTRNDNIKSAELPSVLGTSATVALLTLSQVLAVGVLSATPLGSDALARGVVAAIVAATIGGVLVAMLARPLAEISAPASSIAVIYAALCADLVTRAGPNVSVGEIWAALSLTVILTGVVLAIAGWLRLADAIKFMPSPVSAGFVTGIGLLVMWSQIGPALGLESRLSSYDGRGLVEHMKPASLLVVAGTILVMLAYPKVFKRGQAALAAVLAGTAVYYALAWLYGGEYLGPLLGALAPTELAESNVRSAWTHVGLSWLMSTSVQVLPYAAFLALQAIMNAAVTAAAVGVIVGERPDVNRTLRAQGVANIVCGALAALPVTTAGSLSLPTARMKPVSTLVPLTSCVILFVALLTAGGLLAAIPVAVLSGILIVNGVNLIDRWAWGLGRDAWRARGRDTHVLGNLIIVAAVAATFFLGSVPLALLVGALLAMVLLAVNLSRATTFDTRNAAQLGSTRVWPDEQARWLAEARAAVTVFRPRGGLFFGTADELASRLDSVGETTRYCVIDVSRTTTLDATGCQIVGAGAKKLAQQGVTTILAGLNASSARARELIALGLSHPHPKTHWFDDLDHALEWVEAQLLKERWPDVAVDTPVDVSDTPLTEGLSPAELEELRSCLARVDVEAGPLFRCGDPGDSMYVIDRGLVEIRVANHGNGNSTRLAAFGPGSVFGEIAMLTSGERTADAVCVKPTALYELTRASLLELEKRSPALYARIVSNLNVHLAKRLVAATGIVQAG
jgi:sulfate permease, SulP family